jgi:predicted SPOUT superfamily RNA methylase MTH1
MSRAARLLTFAGDVARIVALHNISEIISFPDDLRIATNATVDKIPDVTQR